MQIKVDTGLERKLSESNLQAGGDTLYCNRIYWQMVRLLHLSYDGSVCPAETTGGGAPVARTVAAPVTSRDEGKAEPLYAGKRI